MELDSTIGSSRSVSLGFSRNQPAHGHQRGHRGAIGLSAHNYSSGTLEAMSHSDGMTSKSVNSFVHNSMNEYNTSALAWHAQSASQMMGASPLNGNLRNGHATFGNHAKRHRGMEPSPAQPHHSGAHHDALMELARENLLLKHQLHVATVEVSRLKSVVEGYELCDESKETSKQSQSRYWTEEEHQRFLEAIQTIGHKDVKAIAQFVGTRNSTQVRTHAQKYFMKLARLKKQVASPGANGGSNPDQDPSEAAADNSNTSMEAAAAAAAASGEAGTSAAAAAAYLAATNRGSSGSKQGASAVQVDERPANRSDGATSGNKGRKPGSPSSMGSSGSGSGAVSDNTSHGHGSQHGVSTSDNTTGNGSTGSSKSNSRGNEHGGSSSESGRCGEASSNDGSDHGFFDTGADEDNFADDLDGGDGGATYLQTDEDIARMGSGSSLLDDLRRREYKPAYAAATTPAPSAGGSSGGGGGSTGRRRRGSVQRGR